MRVTYAKALYDQTEVDAVIDVLEYQPEALMNGPSVKDFEQKIASLFAKTDGVMVNSGSSANLLTFASLGLDPGAQVITPALTFSTTVAPLLQQGLVPAFVDVEPDTFNIDASRIEEMIGPRTVALMIPNLIGNLPDWVAIRRIAEDHDLILVEDSADTIGATFAGKRSGVFSDVSTTSFYASHVITAAGFGGMFTTSDAELAQRARLLRGWGRSSALVCESEQVKDRFDAKLDGVPYDAKFLFSGVGYNFLPSEIAAAFGLVQLKRLDTYLEVRKRNFTWLRRFFADYEEWFVLPRQHVDADTAWLAFPLIVRDDAPFTRRDLQVHFERHDVQTRVVFTGNILRQPGFTGMPKVEHPDGYPNADQVLRGGLLLGCHQAMTEDQLVYIADTFTDFATNV